jgi:hypothetical protein
VSKTDNTSPDINSDNLKHPSGTFPLLTNNNSNTRASPVRPSSKGLNLAAAG